MGLTPPEQAVVRLSSALACRSEPGVRAALVEADEVAEPPLVEEAILQSYLFLGYPAALNGFALWRVVSGRSPGASEDTLAPEGWAERGEAVCRIVYGGQYERLKDNVRALQADMERWMIVEGYGKVLGRPGMPLDLRELCIVAMLTVQDVPRQLYSHLRGALNAGAGVDRVEATLSLAQKQASPAAADRARSTWRSVLASRTDPVA